MGPLLLKVPAAALILAILLAWSAPSFAFVPCNRKHTRSFSSRKLNWEKWRSRRQVKGHSCSVGDDSAAADLLRINRILCKTQETFKLADLYHVEISQRALSRGMTCDRIGIDPATGSSILAIEGNSDYDENMGFLSESSSIEWAGMELAAARNVDTLVEDLKSRAKEIEEVMRNHCGSPNVEPQWTLDYVRMGQSRNEKSQGCFDGSRKKQKYTAKTLGYAVAQALRVSVAINPSEAKLSLCLVDTPSSISLCLVNQNNGRIDETATSTNVELVRGEWAARPFQYSSAMNPIAAEIIVGVLLDMCNKAQKVGHNYKCTNIHLLDPTCGSGTFLAYAFANGASVVGWDVNDSCVQGTKANLDYLIEKGLSVNDATAYTLERRDAALKGTGTDICQGNFDCTVANLPWGQNTPKYYEENGRILRTLKEHLSPGSPCAFVSRDTDIQVEMKRLGYDITATACIPQSNFSLPKSRKKRKSEPDDNSSISARSSNSVVTFART